MKISLIAAMAENRVIGRDNRLPWHLPDDLERFKRLTTGHTVIMGRKTFESIGKPLPGRRSIVVTTRPMADGARGAVGAGTLEEALELVEGEAEVFVAGGEAIYRLTLPKADRLYL
ncbi:MAG: dihydrofolate reductase, partial [Planctomycetota bacterium]